mmetsp:Transcript_27856/g.50253  ORF Transcript_27856/g.50253 Transcript_27856/m.50253 type:complete len:220 (-) Transcript_27856:124-783(-)
MDLRTMDQHAGLCCHLHARPPQGGDVAVLQPQVCPSTRDTHTGELTMLLHQPQPGDGGDRVDPHKGCLCPKPHDRPLGTAAADGQVRTGEHQRLGVLAGADHYSITRLAAGKGRTNGREETAAGAVNDDNASLHEPLHCQVLCCNLLLEEGHLAGQLCLPGVGHRLEQVQLPLPFLLLLLVLCAGKVLALHQLNAHQVQVLRGLSRQMLLQFGDAKLLC